MAKKLAPKALRETLEGGNAGDVLDVLKKAETAGKDLSEILLLKADALIELGKTPKALRLLEEAIGTGAEPVGVLSRLIKLSQEMGRNSDACNYLAQLVTHAPDDVDWLTGWAHRALRLNDPYRAEVFANKALAIEPGNSEAHHVAYLAVSRSKKPARIEAVIKRAIKDADKFPGFPNLSLAISHLPEKEAGKLKGRLRKRWPDETARTFSTRKKLQSEIYADFQKPVELALAGQREEAVSAFRALDWDSDTAEGIRLHLEQIEPLLRAIPGPDDRRRPLAPPVTGGISTAPSMSGTTVLSLGGLGQISGDHQTILDAFLARGGHGAIYLHDSSRRVFFGGVPELGPDFDSTIAALRDVIAGLNTRRLVVMGHSANACAAIHYAGFLGADLLVCASLPASGGAETRNALKDRRATLLIKRLIREFPNHLLDMREQVLTFVNPPKIQLYYAADHPIDAQGAEHMAGLPTVTLHPLQGYDLHNLVAEMILTGTLDRMMEEVTAAPPVWSPAETLPLQSTG